MQSISLSESEVPGALLNERKPEELKIPELKLWLTCRQVPKNGMKANFIEKSVLFAVFYA